MFVTKRSLPRRTFLRGLGATVALPLLDAMVPSFTAVAKTAASPQRRFGAIYIPHGAIMNLYTPAETGGGFQFTPILKPLERFKEHVVVVSNLDRPGIDDSHATAKCYTIEFQATDDLALQPLIVGRWYDDLAKVDGRWRFVERRWFSDLVGDLSAHLKPEALGWWEEGAKASTRA